MSIFVYQRTAHVLKLDPSPNFTSELSTALQDLDDRVRESFELIFASNAISTEQYGSLKLKEIQIIIDNQGGIKPLSIFQRIGKLLLFGLYLPNEEPIYRLFIRGKQGEECVTYRIERTHFAQAIDLIGQHYANLLKRPTIETEVTDCTEVACDGFTEISRVSAKKKGLFH